MTEFSTNNIMLFFKGEEDAGSSALGDEDEGKKSTIIAPTVHIVDALVGPPSEADVQRAATFGAVLLCFNVAPSANVRIK